MRKPRFLVTVMILWAIGMIGQFYMDYRDNGRRRERIDERKRYIQQYEEMINGLETKLGDHDTEAISRQDLLAALRTTQIKGLIRDVEVENAIDRSARYDNRHDIFLILPLVMVTIAAAQLIDRTQPKGETTNNT